MHRFCQLTNNILKGNLLDNFQAFFERIEHANFIPSIYKRYKIISFLTLLGVFKSSGLHVQHVPSSSPNILELKGARKILSFLQRVVTVFGVVV